MALATSDLILRSPPQAGVSKDGGPWFETRSFGALLTMRGEWLGCLIIESVRCWSAPQIPLIPAKAGIQHF